MKINFFNKINFDGTKKFALLIDPDKHTKDSLLSLINLANQNTPDFIFIGGSLLFSDISKTIQLIKENTTIPVIIFPGSQLHIANNADGILFLSLISGRNPEFLIGNHVLSAAKLKMSNLEVIPTGYILINCGSETSVSYMSNTTPIPYLKNDIAKATAMAGELLGLQCIYLEGGSGAKHPVSASMIQEVKQSLDIPLIVGGGIKTNEQMKQAYSAGADLVVIGNILEKTPDLLAQFKQVVNEFNS